MRTIHKQEDNGIALSYKIVGVAIIAMGLIQLIAPVLFKII